MSEVDTYIKEEQIRRNQHDMSELKNEKQITWSDIEVALATEIVEESKKKSKRWFTAWIVTAAALVASNLAWIAGEMK